MVSLSDVTCQPAAEPPLNASAAEAAESELIVGMIDTQLKPATAMQAAMTLSQIAIGRLNLESQRQLLVRFQSPRPDAFAPERTGKVLRVAVDGVDLPRP